MKEPQNWDLLARYLASETSAEQKREVEEWIGADSENRQLLEKLKMSFSITAAKADTSDLPLLWNKIAEKAALGESLNIHPIANETKIDKIMRPLPWPNGFSLRSPFFRIAAVAALLIIVAISLKNYWMPSQLVEVSVPAGGRSTLVLADGTRVILDAGSQLTYPETFRGRSRNVSLRGEAFFQVTPDKSAPFIVTAEYGQIEVLGTAFNVRTWGSGGAVEVSVQEGHVRFGQVGQDESNSVSLKKNQASRLVKGETPSVPMEIDIEKQLAWLQDEAFFENAALAEVFDRLQRWYNVEVLTDDSSLFKDRLTLHLSKSSIENSINLVASLTGSEVEQINGKYYLRPSGKAAK